MDIITNPLFFIFLLIAGYFYYRRQRSVYDRRSFANGEAFVHYTQDVLFHGDCFVLVEETHNYEENSRKYMESSMKPDFTFRPRSGGEPFYVVAKYRPRYYNDVQWCTLYQLDSYKEINKLTAVYIAIGIGGSANAPKYVYVIPLSELDQNTFQPSRFGKYSCPAGYPIHADRLMSDVVSDTEADEKIASTISRSIDRHFWSEGLLHDLETITKAAWQRK